MDHTHAAIAAAVDGHRTPGDLLTLLAPRQREADVTAALGELATLGFVRVGDAVTWTTPELARVVPAFLSLVVDRFDLFEMPLPDSPAFFFAAAPRPYADHLLPEAARQASGRGAAACGLTRADALLCCLGEAAELIASCWHGDEPVQIASYSDVSGRAIAPSDLMGYSEAQYRERDAWNAVHGEYDRIPPPLADDTPIAWTEARYLASNEPVLIPAACAFIGFRDDGLDEPFYIADSNGCAVGATEQDAITRGLLEIVERDATGLWWYGQRRCPAVPPADIEAAGIGNAIAWHGGSGRSLAFLDISSDLGIPVCAAVTANADGSQVMLGFGAHFEMPRAVSKAMAEMVQMEMGAAMMGVGAGADLDQLPPGLRHWLANVTLDGQPQLRAHDTSIAKPRCETPDLPTLAQRVRTLTGNSPVSVALAPLAPGMGAHRVALPGATHYRYRAATLASRTQPAMPDEQRRPAVSPVPLSI